MAYNGGAVVAMTGKNCIAIATCVARALCCRAPRDSPWRAPPRLLLLLLLLLLALLARSDKRLGVQGMTVSCDFPKVFKMHDRLFIGLVGLASDVQTVCVPGTTRSRSRSPRAAPLAGIARPSSPPSLLSRALPPASPTCTARAAPSCCASA